jgi:hypothetical protein
MANNTFTTNDLEINLTQNNVPFRLIKSCNITLPKSYCHNQQLKKINPDDFDFFNDYLKELYYLFSSALF